MKARCGLFGCVVWDGCGTRAGRDAEHGSSDLRENRGLGMLDFSPAPVALNPLVGPAERMVAGVLQGTSRRGRKTNGH